jgi:hypothetical protein
LEIFIRPLYGPGRRRQVSRSGGSRPRWSHDGTELFFAWQNQLFAAALEVGDDIRVRTVETLFDMGESQYDVFPGDSLFVILDLPEGAEVTHAAVSVVLNFEAEIRRLVGRR